MVKIVGVRFRNAGKVYYFDPKNYKVRAGDHVIVETVRGVEYGTVVGEIRSVDEKTVVQPLRAVIRVATQEDDDRATRNRAREKDAMRICREKIKKHNLDMKLVDAEYTFDNNKVLFYFTADGRIDFRELVKDLASVFKMRIELRQIGVRDETKILGGVGICGRVLCCNSYLSEFAPVSIKMAKEQNLSLNPTKISGICGRLMCCLKNEEDTYEYLNSRLPAIGDTVTTLDGQKGEVSSVNVLRQRVRVLVDVDDEKELQEFDVKELKFKPRRRKEKGNKDKNREKDRGGKDGSGKDGSGKDGSGKDGSGKDNSGKDGSGKDNSGKDGSGQEGSGKDSSGKDRGGKDSSRKDNFGKDGSGKYGSGRGGNANGYDSSDQDLKELEKLEALDKKEGKSKLDDD